MFHSKKTSKKGFVPVRKHARRFTIKRQGPNKVYELAGFITVEEAKKRRRNEFLRYRFASVFFSVLFLLICVLGIYKLSQSTIFFNFFSSFVK